MRPGLTNKEMLLLSSLEKNAFKNFKGVDNFLRPAS